MWWLIRECGGIENVVAQRGCDGSSGNMVAWTIWWNRVDVVAHQGMWWHRANMVAQMGSGGSSGIVVA